MSDVDVTNIPTLPNTATLEKIQEYCMQDCKTLLSCVLAYTAELLEIY